MKKNSYKPPALAIWHKRIGIGFACLIILITLTGIPLNHIDHWNGLQTPLPRFLTSFIYGIPEQVDSIHWQRLLLDLHAGRFLGAWRFVVLDLIALSLLFLAGSGLYAYFKSRNDD